MTECTNDLPLQKILKLLKILAIGRRQVEEGKVRPAEDVIAELRQRVKK